MTDANETKVFSYHFNSSIPVPEKARAMGIGRYAHVAWRNMEIAVRVTVPEKALEFSLIELPEQKKGNIAFIEIVMDASLGDDQIQVCLPREDLAKMQDKLLEVDYDREQLEGKVVVTISLPPPVAVIRKRISLPRITMGEYCSNAVVSVEFDNVAGVFEPYQGGKQRQGQKRGRYVNKDRTVNHRLQTMSKKWFSYWVNRKVNPDDQDAPVEEYNDTYFWPSTCQLRVHANNYMRQSNRDLVTKDKHGNLCSENPMLEGAHVNILHNIADGLLDVYLVPEYASFAGGPGQRQLFTQDFQKLVQAMDNTKISDELANNFAAPRTDSPNDFFCCMGVNDPRDNNTVVTYAAFGYTASLYEMWQDEKRRWNFALDDKGQKIPNRHRGALVIIPIKTARQAVGALYAEFVNGGMDKFYEDHMLLVPEEAFLADDEAARELYHKQRNQNRPESDASQNGAEKTDDDQPPESEGEPEDEDKEVDFGEFGDKLPPAASGNEEETDDDSEDSDDDESEEEDSEDDTQPPQK